MGFPVLPQRDAAQVGERVFFSKDVSQIARISLRQLQWWDERRLVSPEQQEHRRAYSSQQVLEILTIATLRKKGMSLQTIKVVVRQLRRQLGQLEKKDVDQPALYVLTDGKSVYLEGQPERVVNRLSKARTGMYLVCLSDLIRVMTTKKFPQRYLTKQLQLF